MPTVKEKDKEHLEKALKDSKVEVIEKERIDLSECKGTMDPETGEIFLSCPVKVFDRVVILKPTRITFELLPEEKESVKEVPE